MVIKHKPGTGADMERVIQELASKVVKVGYFPHSRYPDGKPIAGVAAVQELGSVKMGIPPRPTKGPAIEKGQQKIRDGIAAATRRALKGTQTVDQGLDQLGMVVVGDIKKEISELTKPELKESTLAARRRVGVTSEKPLVLSGLMLQEVTHAVEGK